MGVLAVPHIRTDWGRVCAAGSRSGGRTLTASATAWRCCSWRRRARRCWCAHAACASSCRQRSWHSSGACAWLLAFGFPTLMLVFIEMAIGMQLRHCSMVLPCAWSTVWLARCSCCDLMVCSGSQNMLTQLFEGCGLCTFYYLLSQPALGQLWCLLSSYPRLHTPNMRARRKRARSINASS